MQTETEEKIQVLYREAFAHRRLIAASFVVVSLVMLLVGMNWPKSYESSTTIMIEEQNIIEPLMRGAAVSSDVLDRAHNAREIIFSRAILMGVLEDTGRLDDELSPVEIEWLMEGLRGSTTITQTGRNLIQIQHQDADPELAYRTTKKFAALFLDEMTGSKSAESAAAFAFIDSQVQQYEQKLERSEQRLQALRADDPDARPEARAEVAGRITTLQGRVDDLEQRLREARIAESSLQEQLSGEAEGSARFSRAEQLRRRIVELEGELDRLRLTFHDTYPDVIQLRNQIQDLEQALVREESGESQERSSSERSMRANPVYQELQGRLYEARTTTRTLESSLENARAQLAQEEVRAARMEALAADLAKLMRDHEVNQGIYEDLQRRRENARVSVNLSQQQQGLNIRVYEPAHIAHRPSSPGLSLFALGGFVLGGALPLGLLFGFLLVDPRVRTASTVTRDLELKLLGLIPHMSTPAESARERRGLVMSGLVVVLTVVAVIAFLLLRA